MGKSVSVFVVGTILKTNMAYTKLRGWPTTVILDILLAFQPSFLVENARVKNQSARKTTVSVSELECPVDLHASVSGARTDMLILMDRTEWTSMEWSIEGTRS